MTSLEHESNDTSVSASDYGADNWDQENWGEMDVSRVAKVLSFVSNWNLLDVARSIVAARWSYINAECHSEHECRQQHIDCDFSQW